MLIEYPYTVKNIEFAVRPNTWDACTVDSILTRDEYGLMELSKRIPPPTSIVDIGGHIGSFVLAALSFWPKARIASFEAFTDNYLLLRLNTKGCYGVKTYHYAVVGDNKSEVKFQSPCAASPVPERGPCTGGCFVSDEGDVTEPACGVNFVMEAAGAGVVDLLKIDCEGSEEHILPALADQGLLNRVSVCIGEWHKPHRKQIVEQVLSKTHAVTFIDLNETEKDLGLFAAFMR